MVEKFVPTRDPRTCAIRSLSISLVKYDVRSKIQFTRNESNDSFYECSFGESFSEVSQTTVTQHKFLIFILGTSLYWEKMKKEFERLPRNVVPNFYHLDITPSFETFKEGMKLTLIHHPLYSASLSSWNAKRLGIDKMEKFRLLARLLANPHWGERWLDVWGRTK